MDRDWPASESEFVLTDDVLGFLIHVARYEGETGSAME